MTVFCMKCGAELDEGAKFCNVCGARVNRASDSRYRDSNGLSGDTAPNMAPLPPSMPQDYIRYDGSHARTGAGKVVAIVCGVALVAVLAAGGTWFALNSASSGSSNPVPTDGIATVPGTAGEVSTASGEEGGAIPPQLVRPGNKAAWTIAMMSLPAMRRPHRVPAPKGLYFPIPIRISIAPLSLRAFLTGSSLSRATRFTPVMVERFKTRIFRVTLRHKIGIRRFTILRSSTTRWNSRLPRLLTPRPFALSKMPSSLARHACLSPFLC